MINELFIFVSGILLLPLTNILTNLNSRDTLGIALTVLLAICIAFNIIVLLLRSCYLGYHLLCKKPEPIFDEKLTDVETESPVS